MNSHSISKERGLFKAFTLIELLICIAVILILIAMLMPTLSKVRYRAKLIVCINNLKQVALASTSYAGEYDSHHPYRTAISDGGWGGPENVKAGSRDDRHLWPEMRLDEIWCPFNAKMDTQQNATYVFDSYAYYFGMRFGGYPPMDKLG